MISDPNVVHSNQCKCLSCASKCLSWKPIIAGALIIVGLSFLLNLFMAAIGVNAFTLGDDGAEKLAMSGAIATGVGIVVSMFAAGWLTGYLGKGSCSKGHLGALYGFLAWTLALIITIFIALHAQQYVSFYGHFISGTAQNFQPMNSVAATAVNTVKNVQPDTLVISAYVIFVLFFLSAFACSLGGHCGMRHKCKENCHI